MTSTGTLPDARNMRVIGHTDLDGSGDGMHVQVVGDLAYVAHMGESRVGTSIVDISDLASPRVIRQLQTPEGTHTHKVQIVDDIMVINHERNLREPGASSWSAGLEVFELSDPTNPQSVGFHPIKGKGIHRVTYWEHPYAYVSASDEGYTDQFFMAIDLSDPANPVEAGRWALPGMHKAAGETPTWEEGRRSAHHHCVVRGKRAYCGWVDSGLVILDISTISSPQMVSHLHFGSESKMTHSTVPVPGTDLLVVVEEALADNCQEIQKNAWTVDISDETRPTVVGKFPIPEGDFCSRGGRFGPHNIHEMRPGSYQSDRLIYLTYFNAGIRVVDISDPSQPVEVGHYIPEPPPGQPTIQFNDILVHEDRTIFVTDRFTGGLYIMEYTGE